jgi:hypothetical protein
MTDKPKQENFLVLNGEKHLLEDHPVEILVKWSEKEMRTPSMQLKWVIMKHAPSALKTAPTIMEAAAEFVESTEHLDRPIGTDVGTEPPPTIKQMKIVSALKNTSSLAKPYDVLPALDPQGSTNTRAAIINFHKEEGRARGKICTTDEGWQRRRQKRGHAKYSKQRLRSASLMYRVLLIMSEYGEDLTNYELAALDGNNAYDSYCKVTSTAWDGGLIERKPLLRRDRRGYFTYRLLPQGRKALAKVKRVEGTS